MSNHKSEAYLEEVRKGIAIISIMISVALALLALGLGANIPISVAIQIVSFLISFFVLCAKVMRPMR